ELVLAPRAVGVGVVAVDVDHRAGGGAVVARRRPHVHGAARGQDPEVLAAGDGVLALLEPAVAIVLDRPRRVRVDRRRHAGARAGPRRRRGGVGRGGGAVLGRRAGSVGFVGGVGGRVLVPRLGHRIVGTSGERGNGD